MFMPPPRCFIKLQKGAAISQQSYQIQMNPKQLTSNVEKKVQDKNEWVKCRIVQTRASIDCLSSDNAVIDSLSLALILEIRTIRLAGRPFCLILIYEQGHRDLNKWVVSYYDQNEMNEWQNNLGQISKENLLKTRRKRADRRENAKMQQSQSPTKQKNQSLSPDKKREMEQAKKAEFNFRFLQALEYYSIINNNSPNTAIFSLGEVMQEFKEKSYKIAEGIVYNMIEPGSLKQFKADLVNLDEGVKVLNSDVKPEEYTENYDELYLRENIIFKIATTKLKNVHKAEFPAEMYDSADKDGFLSVYDDTRVKMLKNEFRYLDVMNNVILKILHQIKDFNVRVPLANYIEIKGFVVLAIAYSQVQDSNGLLNSSENQKGKLKSSVKLISKLLNLKDHQLLYDPDCPPLQVLLSVFMEIHLIDDALLNDLRQFEIDNKSPLYKYPSNKEIYLALKCSDIMPVDVVKEYQSHKRLRPEFVRQYSKSLNADALMNMDSGEEWNEDDRDLLEACKYLREQLCIEMIDFYDSLDIGPIYEGQLQKQLHELGINMRYIGAICENTRNVYVKNRLEMEMIGRSLKKVLRNFLVENHFALQSFIENRQAGGDSETKKNIQQMFQLKDLINKESIKSKSEIYYINTLSSFMSMIFQDEMDSHIFWNCILKKQIYYDFKYNLDISKRSTYPPILLIQIIKQQCKISFEINKMSQIFRSPDVQVQQLGFLTYVKTYSIVDNYFDALQKNIKEMIDEKKIDKAKMDLYLILEFIKKNSYSLTKPQSGVFQQLQCEIDFHLKNYDQILYKIQHYLHSVDQFHSSYYQIRVRELQSNFKKGQVEQSQQIFNEIVSLTKSILGPYNPIITEFQNVLSQKYLEIGKLSTSCKFLKRSLQNNIKSYGLNHIITGQSFEDLGTLLIQINEKEAGLEHLQQACLIYEARILQSVHHQTKIQYQKDLTLKYANLNFKIGMIQIQRGRHGIVNLYEGLPREALICLLKSIRLFEKFPQLQNQLLQSYQLTLNALIQLRDYEKALPICNKIWQKLLQFESATPHKFETIMKQTLVILMNQLSKPEQYYIVHNVEKLPRSLASEHQNRVQQYQELFNKNMQALGGEKGISESMQRLVDKLKSPELSVEESELNVVHFVGADFFVSEIEKINK